MRNGLLLALLASALFLQSFAVEARAPLLGHIDFFVLVIVAVVGRVAAQPWAFAACMGIGLMEDAFACTPFGLGGLVGLAVCSVLWRLKDELALDRVTSRALILFSAVWARGIGSWVLARLVCGLNPDLPLVMVLTRSLITAVFGALVLSPLLSERRTSFAAL